MNPELETIVKQQAQGVSEEIRRIAMRGGTETDFRREAARLLEDAGEAVGLTIVPRDEFSVARGRVDSVYNRLILEYKRPGIISATNNRRTNMGVIKQVKEYILDVAKREKREVQRLAGVATDGFYFIFVRRVGEGWIVDDPAPVSPTSTEHFLRLLFSLSAGAALVPDNLVEDFGPRTLRAQRAVRALYTALHASNHPLVLKLFEQWKHFFSEATDYREWGEKIEGKQEFRTFVKGMGLDPKYVEAPKVFYALHTYYALLIKLVASLAAARFAGHASTPLSTIANKYGHDLKNAFSELERGGLFREYGIRNFLEGDFFGWYIAAWDTDIEDATSRLVKRLSEYDPGSLELAPENARDLLKKLYHYLLPREIRHDLGEYYTPDWLAERLIIQTLGQKDTGNPLKRVLDPSCGSGTFLVILIRYIKENTKKGGLTQAEKLNSILKNVIGFDLNPLAVIAARTNYLLALGDLLNFREGDIDIPVYQADSVLTPSQGTDLFDKKVYALKTSVGEFKIPIDFAEREYMDALANLLDESVEFGVSDTSFLTRLGSTETFPADIVSNSESDLIDLFQQLKNLHAEGLNGVWARIIKNAFAPLFLERCDYVVGNPPWINWESLPEEYRVQTKPLWEKYGLFPHGGMDTILGKGKKDIAMLMTYVSLDRYLSANGKCGFVLPQNIFKTIGSGQGFRKFKLPDNTHFKPLVVEDLVQLKPFEGAANRTAVAVFSKGNRVQYPIPYQVWKVRKPRKARMIRFDTPYNEITSEKITFLQWYAKPVSSLDNTSSWITARRSALKAIEKVMGPSPYRAHEGANSGGANAVYWVEIVGKRPGGNSIVANVVDGAKKKVMRTQAAIEDELLYPLLRGRDVSRWAAVPSICVLMSQDPSIRRGISIDVMESKYPKSHSYFSRFEKFLRMRPSFRRYFRNSDPYWSMFNVGSYTFSKWKVVWREQASTFTAAVIGPQNGVPVVPDHKLMMVAIDSPAEAHYLCSVLNSTPSRAAISSYAIQIQMNTHILKNIRIPTFKPDDETHIDLSRLSEKAHNACKTGNIEELQLLEDKLDYAASRLWNISNNQLAEMKRTLEEA